MMKHWQPVARFFRSIMFCWNSLEIGLFWTLFRSKSNSEFEELTKYEHEIDKKQQKKTDQKQTDAVGNFKKVWKVEFFSNVQNAVKENFHMSLTNHHQSTTKSRDMIMQSIDMTPRMSSKSYTHWFERKRKIFPWMTDRFSFRVIHAIDWFPS